MKKIIRLNESDLQKIVRNVAKRVIKEGNMDEYNLKDFGKDALGFGLGAGAFGGAVAGNAYLHGDDPDIDPEQAAINQTIKDDLGQDVLKPQHDLPNDTISWEKANQFEGKISRVVSESLKRFINEVSWTDSDGVEHKDQHGNDSKAWDALRKERWNRYEKNHDDGVRNAKNMKNAEASFRNASNSAELNGKQGMTKAFRNNAKSVRDDNRRWNKKG